MKNLDPNIRDNKFSSFLRLVVFLLLGNIYTINAQVRVNFEQRTAAATPTQTIYSIKGDFAMIGNTNLTLQNYGDNTTNGGTNMIFVDVDGDGLTSNSSSAILEFSTENGANASCTNILFAGLYWSGRGNNLSNTAMQTIKMKKDGGSYTTLVANASDIRYPGDRDMYVGFVEVTDIVQANGDGKYFVADMALSQGNGGSTGYYGGWGLIVIYENAKMKWRDVTVFDGYAYVSGVGGNSASYEFPVSGFNAVQNGPVNLKLGLMAGEGDRNINGDYFQIQERNTSNWESLSHSSNSENNFFNSSINTGGNTRTPNLLNNTGIDIAMFDIDNQSNGTNYIIDNGQTSTKFRYGTSGDTFVIFTVAMAVDAFVPEIEGIVTTVGINGQPPGAILSANPGEVIEYKIELRNKGTEAITNTKLVIPMPFTSTYVDLSVSTDIFSPLVSTNGAAHFNASLGANGSIVWDIGDLPLASSPSDLLAELSFKYKITTDCLILNNPNCAPKVEMTGGITGKGAISLKDFDIPLIQGYETSGSCIGDPIATPLIIPINVDNISCGTYDVISIDLCDRSTLVLPSEIASLFPNGSRFYNEYPVTNTSIEYTDSNPLPLVTASYFAVPEGLSTCYFDFNVNVYNSPIISTTTKTNVSCYGGSDGTVTTTATGGTGTLAYNLLYSLDGIVAYVDASATDGDTDGSYTGLGAGFYQVSITNDGSSCSPVVSAAVTITEPAAITMTATPTQISCFGGTGSVVLSSDGVAPFTYGGDATTGLIAGTYNYTVTNANGCTAITSATISIAPAAITMTATPTQISCFGGTGSVVLSSDGVAPFTYGGDATTGLIAGTYNYTVTDANGCTAITSATISIAPAAITMTATPTQISCFGGTGSVVLSSDGVAPFTYGGDATTGLIAGTYNYTVTDANGCTAITSATISIAPAAITMTATPTQISCFGGTGSVVLSSDGVAPFTYGGDATTGLIAGTYNYTVTDANGCTAITSATISIAPAAITMTATPTQISCFGGTGSVVLSSDGVAPFTYGGDATTGLIAGTYNYTVTDANGCTAITSATISIAPAAITMTATPTQISCFGGTGSVVLSSDGVAPFTYGGDATTGLIAGTYNYTVTDANGCTAITSATISIAPAAITMTATPTQISCFGGTGSVVLSSDGVAPFTYGGDATTGLIAGTYNYTVTNANGCTAITSATISIAPAAITMTATPTQISCFGGTGSVVLSSDGAAPFTYGGDATTGLIAGTYNYTVTNANGCTAITSATISIAPAAITMTATPTQISCFGGTGSVVLSSDGVAPFTYGGDATTGLIAGTYNYTVTNANGCTAITSATISIAPAAITMTATPTQISCFGGTGSVVLSSDGAAPFTYGGDATTGLIAGTYNYTVTNANGCTAITSATISIAPAAITMTATPTQISCFGGTGSVVLSSDGVAPFTYGGDATTGLIAGTYNYTVTNANGCTAITSATISIAPAAITMTATPTQISCFGGTGSVVLSSDGVAPFTYGGDATTGLIAGTYNYTVTNANGCTAITSATIIEPDVLVVDLNKKINVLCSGLATGSIDITVLGGTEPYTYVWNNGGNTQDISGLAAGVYNVEVTDSKGCMTEASFTISEPGSPLSLNISKTDATSGQACTNGNATVVASGGIEPYTYQWGVSAGNQTTASAINLASGTHSITVIDANGCVIEQSIVIECVNTCDAVILIDSTSNVLCKGDATGSGTVSASSIANPSATFTFTWSSGQVNSGVTSSTLNNIEAGVYTVSVTIDGTVCQPVEDNITISEPSNSVQITASSTDESGPSTGDGTATAIGTGGVEPYSYSWSNGGDTAEITNLSVGSYTVIITDANGCTEETTVLVNSGTCQDLSVSGTGTAVTCSGLSNGSVSAVVSGGVGPFTYSWNGLSNTSLSVDDLPLGDYTITVTDETTACTTSTTLTVSSPSVLSSGTAVTHVKCHGSATGSIDLTVIGGTFPYTFEWSDNSTDEDLINATAGIYMVTVTDANGCSTENKVEILEPSEAVSAEVTLIVDAGCENDSTGSATVVASGGIEPYNYLWNDPNGQITATATGLLEGNYQVIITDANNCSITLSDITIEKTIITSNLTVEVPIDITVECSEDFTSSSTGFATGSNGCGSVTITEEDSVEETCGNSMVITRTWTVEDVNGNSVSGVQIITVIDNTPPVIIDKDSYDEELTVTCEDIPSPYNIVAEDNCSTNITTEFEEQVLDADANGNYQIIRAWSFEDECDNTSTFVQTINVEKLDVVISDMFICIDDIAFDLSSLVPSNVSSDGVWTIDDNTSGVLSDGVFDVDMLLNDWDYDANFTRTFELTYNSSTGSVCNFSESFSITVNNDCVVLPCSTDDISISRVLTPNGDGHNEVFEVGGLETCGFTYDVIIFNRWGAVVYQSANYQNNWTGINQEGGLTIGSSATLPSGTYYYAIKVLGGNGGNGVDSSVFKPITGYIYLGN